MIRFVSAVSFFVAGAIALPSVASAQMEQPMSGMSHKMTKKQMMMKKKKKMMMMHKKKMNTGGM